MSLMLHGLHEVKKINQWIYLINQSINKHALNQLINQAINEYI